MLDGKIYARGVEMLGRITGAGCRDAETAEKAASILPSRT
jgi:hypothetical protein